MSCVDVLGGLPDSAWWSIAAVIGFAAFGLAELVLRLVIAVSGLVVRWRTARGER